MILHKQLDMTCLIAKACKNKSILVTEHMHFFNVDLNMGKMNIRLPIMLLSLLKLCFQIGSAEGKVYYITPSTSFACPVETCFILSQFAGQQSYMNATTKLIFLHGNHSLNSDMSVTNINKLSMLPNSFPQAQSIIICQRNVSFEFKNVSLLLIKGIRFVGCGNNKVLRVMLFTLEESTFIGREMSGTALEVIETNMTIFKSSFIYNKLGTFRGPIKILLDNTDVPDYAYVGGTIISNQSNVIIRDSSFIGNSAEVGGVIFATMGSNITINNSTFKNNYATSNTNMSDPRCFGGVLNAENAFNKISNKTYCQIVIVKSLFRNNTASNGGALTSYNCTVNIISSSFFNNSAKHSSGAIQAKYGSNIILRNSLFSKNSAEKGAGVMILLHIQLKH